MRTFINMSPILFFLLFGNVGRAASLEEGLFEVLVRVAASILDNHYDGLNVNQHCIINNIQLPRSECQNRGLNPYTIILNGQPVVEAVENLTDAEFSQAESNRISMCTVDVLRKFYPFVSPTSSNLHLCQGRTDVYPQLLVAEEELIIQLTPYIEFDPHAPFGSLIFDAAVPKRTEKIPMEIIVEAYTSILGRYPSRNEINYHINRSNTGSIPISLSVLPITLNEILNRLQIENAYIFEFGRSSSSDEFQKYLNLFYQTNSISETHSQMKIDLTVRNSVLVVISSHLLN